MVRRTTRFPIPTLAAATGPGGTVLPATDDVFVIPTAGAPSGTVLPGADFAFNVPTVPVTTNASNTVPDLPNTNSVNNGFNIPNLVTLGLVPTAPTSTKNFPDSSAAFDIPNLVSLGFVASAPAGVPSLPTVTNKFTPGGGVRGLASDGTDLWMVSDGTGTGGIDQILKVASSTGSVLATIEGPSSSLEGVAFLNGFLWVLEDKFQRLPLGTGGQVPLLR